MAIRKRARGSKPVGYEKIRKANLRPEKVEEAAQSAVTSMKVEAEAAGVSRAAEMETVVAEAPSTVAEASSVVAEAPSTVTGVTAAPVSDVTESAACETTEKASESKAAAEKAPETEKSPESEKAPEAKEAAVQVAEETEEAGDDTEVNIVLQFQGRELSDAALNERFERTWTVDLGRSLDEVESLALYVKPEDSAAYYVVNEDINGSFPI